MNGTPTVADYMSRELITLRMDTEITRAMATLLHRRISGAPVLDNAGRLVGVLSRKDCLRAGLHAVYHQEPGGQVADYMAREVETLSPEIDIVRACEHFIASSYRRFPVMQEGRLVGQISRADVLRALVEHWQ